MSDLIEWFEKSLTLEQRQELVEYIRVPQAPREADKAEVSIVHVGAVELLSRFPKSPVYEDVFNLHTVFNKLAFGSAILLKGPKGTGKSLSGISWFINGKVPFMQLNCSEGTNKGDLQGCFFLRGRETPFSLGRVANIIQVANEYGVAGLLLEEFNALPPPIQKMMNPALDFRRSIEVDVLGKSYALQPGKKLAIIATMNPSTYGGTYDINEDAKSRFIELEIGYPPEGAEMKILRAVCGTVVSDDVLKKAIAFARDTRQQGTSYSLSTRDLVEFVRTVEAFGIEGGLQIILHKFEGEDRKVAYKRMTSTWPSTVTSTLRKFWGSAEPPDVDK